MLAGKPLAALCSADTANRIGAVLLMLIGCWILFQNHRTQQKSLKAYDRDASSRIDQKEAVVLAFALTINNMGLGISGSITGLPIPVTCLFTFLCSLLFIAVSQVAGKLHSLLYS
ncbi:MAG: manganese efflux pump [Clostridium sp.]